jgi:hypothetical protein
VVRNPSVWQFPSTAHDAQAPDQRVFVGILGFVDEGCMHCKGKNLAHGAWL